MPAVKEMLLSTTPAIPVPQSAAPIDPATLAQWATSLLRSLPGVGGAAPQFYFVDAVRLPSGYVSHPGRSYGRL